MKLKKIKTAVLSFILLASTTSYALDSVDEYIKEYPNQEQVKMMTKWLAKGHKKGTFQFTGLVDPTDTTVVTPQATVDYGYNWFSISDAPAIVKSPKYEKFISVSIFDMKHNIPDVIINPDKPILIRRPGQKVPEGDFHIVELETDQGLVFSRMVVVNNMDEVRKLSKSFTMEGGKGDMTRNVQRFSPKVEENAMKVITHYTNLINPDDVFGKKSGDVGSLNSAAGVKLGQLGTPKETVRYGTIMIDNNGEKLNGKDTYVVTVPANLVETGGYFSVTIYGMDNQLLIPNDKKVYDQTTYSAKQNDNGSYTITLSPTGEGINPLITGKPFYGLLRAYVPAPNADMTINIEKK